MDESSYDKSVLPASLRLLYGEKNLTEYELLQAILEIEIAITACRVESTLTQLSDLLQVAKIMLEKFESKKSKKSLN